MVKKIQAKEKVVLRISKEVKSSIRWPFDVAKIA